MADLAIRSLADLEVSASTTRVLNLHAIHRRSGLDPRHREDPLFRSPPLNRAIFLKHRVRPNEADQFEDRRSLCTKLLLPLDPADLRSGGRYVFVGERSFDLVMLNMFGESVGRDTPDRRMIELIDQSPSFDPFFLREHLRRHGRLAAPCYFDLPEADIARMSAFVENEVRPLVRLAFGRGGAVKTQSGRLVAKMLAGDIDSELEPLRLVMNLDPSAFGEGVFCWKGFLYYKWALGEAARQAPAVSREISRMRTQGGAAEPSVRGDLTVARRNVLSALAVARMAVADILDVYDQAFADLVDHGNPQPFRDFLLSAPGHFVELGARLGAIDHLISFWGFRFPAERRASVTPQELADILLDFETGLAFEAAEPEGELVIA